MNSARSLPSTSPGARRVWLLLVKNDYFDQVCYKVEREGVLTVGKPSSRQTLYGAVKLAAAMSARLAKMERKNKTLQEKWRISARSTVPNGCLSRIST